MTPTCNHCGAKFPGKEHCNKCGLPPNSEVTVAERIARTTASLKKLTKALAPYSSGLRAHERRVEKAAVRSVTNTKRKRKHGRRV